jgi:hypothetical protein
MDYLVSLAHAGGDSGPLSFHSIRSLRLFCLHQRVYDNSDSTSTDYFLVVGYTGGGSQDDCFYKLRGTDLSERKIWIAIPSGDSFYRNCYKNAQLLEMEEDLTAEDRRVQREMIDQLSQHLIYDDEEDYFYVNSELHPTVADGMITSEKFPLAFMPMLSQSYWPFSLGWNQ